MRIRTTPRSGFTLLEMMIAAALLSILLGGLTMLLSTTQGTYETSTSAMNLEREGSRAMRRIVDAVRCSDLASIQAVPEEPLSATSFLFQAAGPYVNGQTQWSDPQQIHFEAADGTIVWTENPGTPEEQSANWCRGVADTLEGEELNFADDNGNGLMDERGLAFVRSGDSLRIYLTLEVMGPDGEIDQKTWTSQVTCRN